MKVGNFDFEYVGDIEPTRDADGAIIAFQPQSRYKNVRQLSLNRYGAGPFCKFKLATKIQVSGVYILAIGGEIRYVGECSNPCRAAEPLCKRRVYPQFLCKPHVNIALHKGSDFTHVLAQ
jgi:hypothetical protein